MFHHFLPAVAILLGVAIILLVLRDAFEVLLLPRRGGHSRRLANKVLRPAWRLWRIVASGFREGVRSDFLSCYGPLSVVILYVIWAVLLIAAYGLCEWGSNFNSPHPLTLANCFYLSGSTFFTLGLGDSAPHSGLGKVLVVAEAANGFGLVAAVIGYLPVLYQSFSSREAHVLQLDARAGSPPSAVFLLSQHGSACAMPELMDYLRHCETWAAALLEGQLSFPVLAFYRSHHDSHSWLATLCAIMDTCAVLLTGVEGGRSFQPRMTFAVGRMAILEMANILQLSPVPPPADRLSSEAYQDITATLKAAGLPWEGGDAEMKLAKLRSTYEPYLYAIATYLVLPVPGWSPSAAPDNWQSGDHGKLARELIDTAEAVTQDIDRVEKQDDTAGDRSSRHS